MRIDEKTIEETASHVAIERLLAAYADVVTRRAWDELDELFLRDAPIHVTPSAWKPRRLDGPRALAELISGIIDGFDFFQFVVLNARLEVRIDDGAASGRVFISEIRRARESGQWTQMFGVYHDVYRRIEGRWWFAQRTFHALATRTGDRDAVFDFPAELHALPVGPV